MRVIEAPDSLESDRRRHGRPAAVTARRPHPRRRRQQEPWLEGVAVAGALLGGPIAGLGVLAAQKLLRDPFEAAGSREYLVTGPWREPDVNKLTKTRKQDPIKDSDG